jgi:hypothetical protein
MDFCSLTSHGSLRGSNKTQTSNDGALTHSTTSVRVSPRAATSPASPHTRADVDPLIGRKWT